MCPLCLTASGLYVAGGLSAGAVTTFLVAKVLPRHELAPGPVIDLNQEPMPDEIEVNLKDARP